MARPGTSNDLRNRLAIGAGAAIGLALGAIAMVLLPLTYQASATLNVLPSQQAPNVVQYSTAGAVVEEVGAELELDADSVSANVFVRQMPGSSLLQVRAESSEPKSAQTLANVFAEVLAAEVNNSGLVADGAQEIGVTVVIPAEPGVSTRGAFQSMSLLIAPTLAGGVLAWVVIAIRKRARAYRPSTSASAARDGESAQRPLR